MIPFRAHLIALTVLVSSATAPADDLKFEPELDGVWKSSYGPIHWDKGWYGQEEHTIEITGARWDEPTRNYVVSGNWGRTTSKTYKGTFQFHFVTPTKFEGWWSSDGSDTRSGWTGTLGDEAAPAAPPEPDPGGGIEPPPPKPRKLDDVAEAEFVPDLEKVWNSTYGEIHWVDGYYGNEEKTLKVVGHGWDSDKKRYVVRGIWGRKSNRDSFGLFEFEFTSAHEFTGRWGGSGLPLPYGWTGSLKEE